MQNHAARQVLHKQVHMNEISLKCITIFSADLFCAARFISHFFYFSVN